MRDQDCGGSTPFCVDTTCAACEASTNCPAARPVCDAISHDCRTCTNDSECDSGACDLGAGACVGQGAIRYASPTGSEADPCIKTAPCSLHHAANLVDQAHSYVVLVPGRYEGFFGFNIQTATVIGNNSTIVLTSPDFAVRIFGGSSVTIRDIHLEEPAGVLTDGGSWIVVDKSVLVIDNMQSNTKTLPAIVGNGGDSVTIRRSSFTGQSVFATTLVADSCVFHTGGPSAASIELTNSVVIADSSSGTSGTAVGVNATNVGSKVVNNTFFQGTVSCGGTGAHFTNNIFYNYTSIAGTPCSYQYNLVTPSRDLGGNGNTTGDPMFVDSAHGDLHLKLGSAAIDAGDPSLVSIDRDFDGTHRPQGTRSDIGAFEYKP